MEKKSSHKFNKPIKYCQMDKEKIIMIKIDLKITRITIIMLVLKAVMLATIRRLTTTIMIDQRVTESMLIIIIIKHISIQTQMDTHITNIEHIKTTIIKIFFIMKKNLKIFNHRIIEKIVEINTLTVKNNGQDIKGNNRDRDSIKRTQDIHTRLNRKNR